MMVRGHQHAETNNGDVSASFFSGLIIMGFESSRYTVLEGEGQVIVCVNITSATERNVTIQLSTIPITAQG